MLVAAVGDSTLRDIWTMLITILGESRNLTRRPVITGHRHRYLNATLPPSSARQPRIDFAFQYIPGVQAATLPLPEPVCPTKWWKASSWSRAVQAQSAIERLVGEQHEQQQRWQHTLLLYGGIQQSLPSGRSIGELARGMASCFPGVKLVVKSAHPAVTVMSPSNSSHSWPLPGRAAALRHALRLDSEVSPALEGTAAAWWDVSPILRAASKSLIVGSPLCMCHYVNSVNRELARSVLASEWWRAWWREAGAGVW